MTDPVVQMLALLAELYTHPPMTDARLAAYRAALSDLSADECDRAYRVMTRTARSAFYPTTNELLEAARPAPKALDVAPLYDDIEYAVLLKRATLGSIEEQFGVAARLAVQAAGGVDAVRRSDPEHRVFTLKRFTEAFLEANTEARVALGPVDDRIKQLTAGIGR